MIYCDLDLESRSTLDLKRVGLAKYARSADTEVLCFVLARRVAPGGYLIERNNLEALKSYAEDSRVIFRSHNAAFEMNILEHRLGIKIPVNRWRCSLALAYYHNLPGTLDLCGQILELDKQKDLEGKQNMMDMCKPLGKNRIQRGHGTPHHKSFEMPFDWDDDRYHMSLERYDKLLEYCEDDVLTEEGIFNRLGELPELEQKRWEKDYIMNFENGIEVDVELCKSAQLLQENIREDLNRECQEEHGFSLTQVAKVKEFLGYEDTTAPTLEKALSTEKDETKRWVIRGRQIVGSKAADKYTSAINMEIDGRVYGTLQFMGASQTGRWSGRGLQIQNVVRGRFDENWVDEQMEVACRYIKEGRVEELVELDYGTDRVDVLKSCTRGMIRGNLTVSDFSQIEARVIAWLAGQEDTLESFRKGQDLYKTAASQIYSIPVEDITKDQRFIGKIATLACIAEGELVLTDQGEVPIEKVTTDMLVWDGVDFVKHEGIIDRGIKEVLTYDGLTATEDHVVFSEDGREISFGTCASQQIPLAQTGLGGQAVWVGDCDLARSYMDWWGGQERPQEQVSACLREMLRVQYGETNKYVQSSFWENEGMPVLQSAKEAAQVVGSTANLSKAALRESKRQELQELRGERNRVPFQVYNGGWSLVDGEHISHYWQGTGSYKQRWPLREGEPKMGHEIRAGEEHESVEATNGLEVRGERLAVLTIHNGTTGEVRTDTRGDTISSRASSQREAQGLAKDKRKVRVYDILNCGPRNRFTVSNRLVHNCGYQGGVAAFLGMAKNYGVEDMDEEFIKDIIQKWRTKNHKIKNLWYQLNDQALEACSGTENERFVYENDFLCMKLPSGRRLHYYKPEIREGKFGNIVTFLTVPGVTDQVIERYKGKRWARVSTYGGKLSNNLCQGVARDILACAMDKVPAEMLRFTVHDELVIDGMTPSELDTHMLDVPEWAKGIPMGTDSFACRRYRK